jgi:hypothetical protein
VDGIYHVIRSFDDADVVHVEQTVDPIRDLEIISGELCKKDLQALNDAVCFLGGGGGGGGGFGGSGGGCEPLYALATHPSAFPPLTFSRSSFHFPSLSLLSSCINALVTLR